MKEEVTKKLYSEDRLGNSLYILKFSPNVDINSKFRFMNDSGQITPSAEFFI